MGCDIHFYVEVKHGERWQHHSVRDRYEDANQDEDGYRPIDYKRYFKDPLYVGRNYDLFAILADVRNGSGFAGCDTGDGYEPISMPRGLPSDASPEVLEEYTLRVVEDALYDENDPKERTCSRSNAERWTTSRGDWLPSSIWMNEAHTVVSGPDWHSASHLLLSELLAYDWAGKSTRRRGWVDPWNYELFRRTGKPKSWCGGVSGGAIEHVSTQQMARMIDGGEIRWEGPEPEEEGLHGRPYSTGVGRSLKEAGCPPGSVGAKLADTRPRHYALLEWPVTYAQAAGRFLTETLPALEKLGPPDSVRIVFWFDN